MKKLNPPQNEEKGCQVKKELNYKFFILLDEEL